MGCDIHPYAEVLRDGNWERARVKVPSARDYWAFAKLAGVRNGSGFAGCDTGDPLHPICEPRGLPSDTSIRDSEGSDDDNEDSVWLGDHSHSWVLLSELLAIDYSEPVTRRGMCKPEVAEHLTKFGRMPWDAQWCAWTSDTSQVKVQWTEPLMSVATLLPAMICSVCHLGKPENIRIVFGFDS